MGVTVFNDKYVRVTRAWDKEETQIYVPIKKSLKAAIKEAEQIDRNLAERQKAFLLRQELSGDRYFHEDGTIVGLRIVTRHREGRKPSNEITLRVKVPDREKPYFSNVSIDKHGFEQAFKLAVDKVCEWNNIEARSAVRQRMLDAADAHRKELSSVAGAKPTKAKPKAAAKVKAAKPAKAAAKPAKADKKSKAAKPVKATKTAKAAAKPVKAAKPAKPTKAAKPAKGSKAAKASTKPAKAAKASKAAKPAKPVKAAKATKPAAKMAKPAAKAKKGKDDEIYTGLMQEVKKFQGKKKNTIRG